MIGRRFLPAGTMKTTRVVRACLLAGPALCLLIACARNQALLEVSGTILYEKPRITNVSHDLLDQRAEGGAAVLTVTMRGDPGLTASFDVSPGVIERQPMRETGEGTYAGEFSFPSSVVGGPFSVIVRLTHEAAGEVTWRDPALITITLPEPAR